MPQNEVRKVIRKPNKVLEMETRYLLRWNKFHSEILQDIDEFRQASELVDAYFYCEDEMIGRR